jgi:hypothetical protein
LELFNILLKLPENIFNITENNNELFRVSLYKHAVVLVKLLLTDKRIIPPVNAIKSYVSMEISDNHIDYPDRLELATILIDYCRGFEHWLYINAQRKTAHNFSKMLILKDKLDLKKIYKEDCQYFMRDKDVIIKFLNDPSIDPFSWNCIMQEVAEKGYTDIFIMLVNKLQGKFTEDYRKSLYSACKYYRVDIVKILLQDKRFGNATINYALEGHASIYPAMFFFKKSENYDRKNDVINYFEILNMLIYDMRSNPEYYPYDYPKVLDIFKE